jgi:hypothetical protein
VAAGGTITLVAPTSQGRNIWISGPALPGNATLDLAGLSVGAQWIPRYGVWPQVLIPQGNGLRLLSIESPTVPGTYYWSIWEVFGTVRNAADPTHVWMSAHYGHPDPEVFPQLLALTADTPITVAHRGLTITNNGAGGDIAFTLDPTGFAVGDRLWIWRVNKQRVRIYGDVPTATRLLFEGQECDVSAIQGLLLGEAMSGVEVIYNGPYGVGFAFRLRKMNGRLTTLCESPTATELLGPEFSWNQPKPRIIVASATQPFNPMGSPSRGGGAGTAQKWTPRVLHSLRNCYGPNGLTAGAEIIPGNVHDFFQLVRFPIAYSFSAPGAQGFAIHGMDATLLLMQLGRRFAVRDANANNTWDTEYIIKGGGYDPGTGDTLIYIEDVGTPGFIETAVAAVAEPMHGGYLCTSLIKVNRPGRYLVRASMRGVACGHTGLRIVQEPMVNTTYDLLAGHVATYWSGPNWDPRRDAYAPSGAGQIEVRPEVLEEIIVGSPGVATPILFEVQQFIENALLDPVYGWASWGWPLDIADGADWWNTDLEFGSIEIIEGNA